MSSRDLKRYDALRDLGCIACKQDGRHSQPDIHHLVTNGYRRLSGGNQATLPLCPWHHRGEPVDGLSVQHMRAKFGPSMFHEAKEFARVYGGQRELLARVNELLKESA